MWIFPTIKIATIDTKRRLILPGAMPGETYAGWQAEAGQYELTMVIPANHGSA